MKRKRLHTIGLLLFQIVSVNAQYSDLHNFNFTDGKWPTGSLSLSGKVLYGMTPKGGAYSYGCVFSINTNGNNFRDIFDFQGLNGSTPYGSLTPSGSILYGMTSGGGANNDGCIFSLDTNGTYFTDLFDFDGSNGANPYGSLSISGDILYGIASNGGANENGCIFSIHTDGSRYKDLIDFDYSINGGDPQGSLTLSGNVLYGITSEGGTNFAGYIFSLDTNGTGFTDLFNFNGTSIGANAYGSLTLSGNKLFGMEDIGGIHDSGFIFSVNTDGSEFQFLHDGTLKTGYAYYGSLLLSGGILYGMAFEGGIYNLGCIFSMDSTGGNYKDLLDFNGYNTPEGSYPQGALITSEDTFYGLGQGSEVTGYGVIFSFKDTSISNSINTLKANTSTTSLYPNPNNGQFTLSLSNISEQCNIEIYAVFGEKVYSQFTIHNSQFTINLSGKPNGIYLYRVLNENGGLIGEGKVVIEK